MLTNNLRMSLDIQDITDFYKHETIDKTDCQNVLSD